MHVIKIGQVWNVPEHISEHVNSICQPQVSSLISPYYFGDPTIFDKGFSPKEDPKLSFEGNKVHTLLKLFQGESSKQDYCKHASPREKERESVANLIRGSYNGPQYIVTLQSPESVAKHSIAFSRKKLYM